MSYGDRRHWDFTIGRMNVSRWCRVPNHLGGRVSHPITVKLWDRAGSASNR